MMASYPYMDKNICNGLIVESKNGREYFPCKVLIDATGDADLIFRAGIPCRFGRNYLTYFGHGCTMDTIRKTVDSKDMVNLNSNIFHIGSDLNGKGHPEDVPYFEGISNEDISQYIMTGQDRLFDKIKTRPKNEQCLYSLPNMTQFRKTRCMIGEETFYGIDGQRMEDSIGAAGDFRKKGKHYEIPIGVLFNKQYPNIIAAGRTISCEDDGWEVARVIPTAAMTGQAAGTLAALGIKRKQMVTEVLPGLVQEKLQGNDVKLHF